MHILWEVVVDLSHFFCSIITVPFKPTATTLLLADMPKTASIPSLLAPLPEPTLLPKPIVTPLLSEASLSELSMETLAPEVAYVATASARVLQKPLWSFDGVYTSFPYGTKIAVLGYEGRFARVEYGSGSAWILMDELTTQPRDVFPEFHAGKIYLAADLETRKVRQFIKDEFFTTDLYLPLQAVEYVQYRLARLGLILPWQDERPRSAGLWHTWLKGRRGVTIKVAPKTGSLMEYFDEAIGLGVLAYAESVTPDETVQISGIGIDKEGCFSTKQLTKEAWQALRPVWIVVQ